MPARDYYKIGNQYDDKSLVCMMPVVEPELDDDTGLPTGIYETRPCGEDLYVDWSFSIPLGQQDEIKPEDVPSWSVAHGWTIGCPSGHVLATSTGDEYGETIQAWMIFTRHPVIGANMDLSQVPGT